MTTLLVGRDLDFTLLRGTFDKAIAERAVQLVTVAGEPGVGKSRLVAELFAFTGLVESAQIHDASCSVFLVDNATIAYLYEVIKPRLLFSFKFSTIANGTGGSLFEGRTFISVVPLPKTNFAIAIERDKTLSGPPRLQHLDLLAQDDSEIATLDGYEGGLTVSPSGKLAAYYVDKENIEVRDLTAPTRVARIRLGPGALEWSPDEKRLLFKRAPERKTAELCWIPVPPLTTPAAGHEIPIAQPDFNPIFHGSVTRDFAISPDGKFLAVIFPGKRNLDLFPLQ